MRTISIFKTCRNGWIRKPILAKNFQHWLIDMGSLTRRLQQRYSQFSVNPISVQYEQLLSDEAQLLQLRSFQHALVRDVLLLGDQSAVVYAHSILPRYSLRGVWCSLGKLGNKPLGATLFSNPKVKRTPLSYKKLMPNHRLFKRACYHLNQEPTHLWARRSIFTLNSTNILVTEVFLPKLLQK